jgi:hypothetical protein
MSKANGDPYDLQPPEGESPGGDEPASKGAGADGYDWVCPNCGAEMESRRSLVCLRCGFDFKSLKVIKTATGQSEVEDEQEEAAPVELVRPTALDPWLPAAIAAGCGLLLVASYLLGAAGLFHGSERVVDADGTVTVSLGARLIGLLRFVILAAFWVGCGVAGLLALAHLNGWKVSRLPLGLLRCAAVVLAMRLTTILSVGSRSMEWTLEMIAHLAVGLGLTMLLFRLKPRDTMTLAVMFILGLMAVKMVTVLLSWVA